MGTYEFTYKLRVCMKRQQVRKIASQMFVFKNESNMNINHILDTRGKFLKGAAGLQVHVLWKDKLVKTTS